MSLPHPLSQLCDLLGKHISCPPATASHLQPSPLSSLTALPHGTSPELTRERLTRAAPGLTSGAEVPAPVQQALCGHRAQCRAQLRFSTWGQCLLARNSPGFLPGPRFHLQPVCERPAVLGYAAGRPRSLGACGRPSRLSAALSEQVCPRVLDWGLDKKIHFGLRRRCLPAG